MVIGILGWWECLSQGAVGRGATQERTKSGHTRSKRPQLDLLGKYVAFNTIPALHSFFWVFFGNYVTFNTVLLFLNVRNGREQRARRVFHVIIYPVVLKHNKTDTEASPKGQKGISALFSMRRLALSHGKCISGE